MHVLLTGATGFIGSAWLRSAPASLRFTVLGRSPPSGAEGRIDFVEVDLSAPSALERAVESGRLPGSVDAVVHLATSRRHREFPDSALDMFAINTAATAHLLDYALRAKASRFILGSTGTVYGGTRAAICREDLPLAPKAYFPATKHSAELLAAGYRERFAVGILRYFVPYGAGQPEDRLVADLLARVEAGRAITLPPKGDGMVFPTLYIDDAVRVLQQCVEQGWNEIVNVSGGEILSLRAAAEIIGRVTGRAPRFERSPAAGRLRLVPDLTRLASRMPVAEFLGFEAGMRRLVERG